MTRRGRRPTPGHTPFGHQPRRRFAQHFLRDPHYIRRILAAIAPAHDETLVEIGPGDGALTGPLLEAGAEIHALEIDRDLASELPARVTNPARLHVHPANALRVDLASLPIALPVRVVGNLPYNITTPLLFHLLDQVECIRELVFMVQLEVAERICAAPGGTDYGRISVMLQYRCDTELLFTVPPGAFVPAPRVQSAVVRLHPRQFPEPARDPKRLALIVRAAFSGRRKTLRNAIGKLLSSVAIVAAGIDTSRRPETLSVREFVRLANIDATAT